MPKGYIFIITKDHSGVATRKGIVQSMKEFKVKKLNKGDYVFLYASKAKFGSSEPYRKMVAYGKVIDEKPYKVVTKDYTAWRRKVEYFYTKETDILKIIPHMSFIENKSHWGAYLISGIAKLNQEDIPKLIKMIKI